MSRCGECGGTLVDHRCVDCGTRHNPGACCGEGTCGSLDRLHDEAFPNDPYLLGRLHAEMERLGYGQVRADGE